MYGGAKLKVWQVIVLGALWVVLGIVLDQTIDFEGMSHYRSGNYYYRSRGGYELFVALKLWITAPIGIAVLHWYRAWEAYQAGRDDEADADLPAQPPAPPAPRPSASPLPPPPRLGDDPFRDPPAAPPIVVQRPPTAPAAAPMAAGGDPDDKPKLLT